MDYKNLLNSKFENKILDAKLIRKDITVLEIVVNTRELAEIESITKQINEFLETQEWFKDDYYVEVLSKGTDLTVSLDEINNNIGKTVKIETIKSFESLNIFIVELLEDLCDQILVKWNKKGQIRKVKFDKLNIKLIEEYIKF
ncbi:hypothetical protein ACJA23_02810 [Mycoplasma corogypsi]|uniref:hypothetical protein n=1 Tax=Mycoplasma corogypsi TaxID=2106 RepID=UPI0038738927